LVSELEIDVLRERAMTPSSAHMIAIGGPLPSSEPLGLFTDCHRRIEAALEVLEAAARWPDPLEGAQRQALERALRFFREMVPKHTADEEQSLFPRLRDVGVDLPELRALEAEHRQAEEWHGEVDQLGEIRLKGGWDEAQRERYAEVMGVMAAAYRRHMRISTTPMFSCSGATTWRRCIRCFSRACWSGAWPGRRSRSST